MQVFRVTPEVTPFVLGQYFQLPWLVGFRAPVDGGLICVTQVILGKLLFLAVRSCVIQADFPT